MATYNSGSVQRTLTNIRGNLAMAINGGNNAPIVQFAAAPTVTRISGVFVMNSSGIASQFQIFFLQTQNVYTSGFGFYSGTAGAQTVTLDGGANSAGIPNGNGVVFQERAFIFNEFVVPPNSFLQLRYGTSPGQTAQYNLMIVETRLT
jgi:hypothetical protein